MPERRGLTRGAAVALAAACALATTGCVVSIGSDTSSPDAERLRLLEERIQRAEEKLGIPPPEAAK